MKTAVIAGAGPAGVTAAYEILIKNEDIKPIILEASDKIGGISATYDCDGNLLDLGPHRFFSKSDRVMKFWRDICAESENKNCFLPINRLTRIFFLHKFFDYPVKLNLRTLKNLGLLRSVKIGLDYFKVCIFPIKEEKSLEDFFINRFGRELYLTFFKDYTEKVWGINCSEISPDWGAQRVKGVSINAVIWHAFTAVIEKIFGVVSSKKETSLIEKFMYPAKGAGYMYEKIASLAQEKGAEIKLNKKVMGLVSQGSSVKKVVYTDTKTGEKNTVDCDYFFSSMPVKELINCFENVPEDVKRVSEGLVYRDYLIVGILLKAFKLKEREKEVLDNWIYLQERDMVAGRLMIVNNFAMDMIKDKNNFWLGVEYFCTEGDKVWSKKDEEIAEFAVHELARAGIIRKDDVLYSKVLRQKKAYPAYFGTYGEFDKVVKFTDTMENVFLIGRNGMHRYNNMDHSVLTAMIAVDNMTEGVKNKSNIWNINTEEEYHEEK